MACVTLDGKPIFGAINRPFNSQAVFGHVNYGLVDSTGAQISIPLPEKVEKKIVVSRYVVFYFLLLFLILDLIQEQSKLSPKKHLEILLWSNLQAELATRLYGC